MTYWKAWDQVNAPAKGPGRPGGGVGQAVEELLGEPFELDLKTARTWVVARTWTTPAGLRKLSYKEVADIHRDWRKDQKKKEK